MLAIRKVEVWHGTCYIDGHDYRDRKDNHRTENLIMVKRAYKGYLICIDTLRETTRIEKDGFHISYAKNEADAKQIIDQLTEK